MNSIDFCKEVFVNYITTRTNLNYNIPSKLLPKIQSISRIVLGIILALGAIFIVVSIIKSIHRHPVGSQQNNPVPNNFTPNKPPPTAQSQSNTPLPPIEENRFVCPISQEPFKKPTILLEDGFTYENDAIEEWLSGHPNNSPMFGKEIPSATLADNLTIIQAKTSAPVCPITKAAFEKPYFCLEDSCTYELNAILTWFETKIKNNLAKSQVKCELPSGVVVTKITLYPNKILFPEDGGIPTSQEPIRCNVTDIIQKS